MGFMDGALVGALVGLGVMTILKIGGLFGSMLYKNANNDAGIAINGLPKEASVEIKST